MRINVAATAATPMSLLLVLVLLVARRADANTNINIHMPVELNINHGYPHQVGHFGRSAMAMAHHAGYEAYGSMSAELVLAPTDLCRSIGKITLPNHPTPFFLLAMRGGCTYVTKTRHAQHMGAAGILIGDHTCDCADGDSCMDVTKNVTDCYEPIMADDGSGGDVTIPSLLLRKQHVPKIQDKLKANESVLVTLRWEPPSCNAAAANNPSGSSAVQKVNYGMILDMMDPLTAKFTSNIKHIALAVGKEAKFYPSYLIYNGTAHKCPNKDDNCQDTCIEGGKYCYPHRKGNKVVQEIFRRLCIWELHGDTNEDRNTGLEGEAFWNYVEYFDSNCAKCIFGDCPGKNQDEKDQKCIEAAYQRAKVKKDEMDACVGDSTHGANTTILEEHLQGLQDYGVSVAPSIWVANTNLPNYWKPPTPTGLLQALCAFYQKTTTTTTTQPKSKGAMAPPKACSQCLTKLNDKDVIQCAKTYYEDNYKYPHRHIWRTLFLFVLICFGAGIGYVVWRRRQDEMDLASDELFNPLRSMNNRLQNINERFQNMNNPLTPYMPLNGNNGNGNDSNIDVNSGMGSSLLPGMGSDPILGSGGMLPGMGNDHQQQQVGIMGGSSMMSGTVGGPAGSNGSEQVVVETVLEDQQQSQQQTNPFE